MYNIEVAWIFQEIADLLELKGENVFKIRAYRKAARIIGNLPVSVEELYKSGQLLKVSGIGKNIASKIEELIKTGDCNKHRELLREIPCGLREIMVLHGIGPKRARLLYEELKVTSLDDLERAAEQKKIRKLPGFGGKTEREILFHIKGRRKNVGRFLLGIAMDLAEELISFLETLPAVQKVSPGGSLRRWKETVADIDIILATKDPEAVKRIIVEHPLVREVLGIEEDRIELMTAWRIPVDITLARDDNYWTNLLWNTGSKKHYIKLQKIAAEKGFKLDRTGLYGNGLKLNPSSEEDIYRHLGLPYIQPELREDSGEIEAAFSGNLPVLLKHSDILGDLHIHTDWSDGVNSIKEVALKARDAGYKYIAVTDHSRSLKITNGLSIERLLNQFEAIKRLNSELEDIHILTGTEVDILPDGSLDFPDDILEKADIVVASVHRAFKQDKETMTNRIISAVKNKHVDIIGHPTGRLLTQREPYELDVERLIEAAAQYGVALEINSSPDRLDLNEHYARMAAEAGVKMSINTDAHDLKRMDEIRYGIAVGRRAWLTKDNVINTLSLQELKNYLRTHKRN